MKAYSLLTFYKLNIFSKRFRDDCVFYFTSPVSVGALSEVIKKRPTSNMREIRDEVLSIIAKGLPQLRGGIDQAVLENELGRITMQRLSFLPLPAS
ncbi:hypothetical protein ACQZV8_16835 [Magnetococcales bacterium HHB-1]